MSRIAGAGSSQNIFTGQKKDFIVMREDTFRYTGEYRYTTADGIAAVYDFTGCLGAMEIKKKRSDTAIIRSVQVTFVGQKYTLYLPADDMDIAAGKYYYDLQIYDGDNTMVTKLYGDFIVLQDVTKFRNPEDNEIIQYMEGIVEHIPGLSVRETSLLGSQMAVIESINERLVNFMETLASYINQLRTSNTVILSSEVAYMFTSYYLKSVNIFQTELAVLGTAITNYYCLMFTESRYTLYT